MSSLAKRIGRLEQEHRGGCRIVVATAGDAVSEEQFSECLKNARIVAWPTDLQIRIRTFDTQREVPQFLYVSQR